jgi:hypothetical protein
MELLDEDQCPTTATNIFSQAPKPESDGGFHQHFSFSGLCWGGLPNGHKQHNIFRAG